MQKNKKNRSWDKRLIRSLMVGMILLAVVSASHAQGPGTSGLENGATGPDGSGGAGVPIDGGLGFMIAAGASYGLKKIRDHRKRSKK
jgi:hypothetical protein